MRTFQIQPTNEGQELNYSETFEGALDEARVRAWNMKTKLQEVLKDGTIDVIIFNEDMEEIK